MKKVMFAIAVVCSSVLAMAGDGIPPGTVTQYDIYKQQFYQCVPVNQSIQGWHDGYFYEAQHPITQQPMLMVVRGEKIVFKYAPREQPGYFQERHLRAIGAWDRINREVDEAFASAPNIYYADVGMVVSSQYEEYDIRRVHGRDQLIVKIVSDGKLRAFATFK